MTAMSNQTSNERALLKALKDLARHYVLLMENGRERIIFLGGDCDPVDVMERGDPYLKQARDAIAAAESSRETPDKRESFDELMSLDPAVLRERYLNQKTWMRSYALLPDQIREHVESLQCVIKPAAETSEEREETEDMANVGRDLMRTIKSHAKELDGWAPCQSPAEVVAHLLNRIDDLRPVEMPAPMSYSRACALLADYAIALQDRQCCGDELQARYMEALTACTNAMGAFPDEEGSGSSSTAALCPHGLPLAENTCGPCSGGRPTKTTKGF